MTDTSDCQYNRLDNGIHEFNFANPNRRAVDQHFEIMDEIYNQLPANQTIQILFVFPKGFPPMNYVFREARTFNSRHINTTGHYAFLYPRHSVMLSVLQSFLSVLPGGINSSFFSDDEREKAIGWLLEKRENPPKK